jgi:heme exporter protein B
MFAILTKDLLVEFRTKETLAALLTLGVLTLLVLSFAFDPTSELRTLAAPGTLWVAVVFAGVLAVNRSFLSERDNDTLQGLLLCPIDRGTIYLAKAAANILFMLAAQAVLLPVFIVFFNLLPTWAFLNLILVLVLGIIGFAAAGTLFAAISVRTRSREVMLPMLLLPIAIPVLIAGVVSSGRILAGDPLSAVSQWIELLIGYDVAVLVVGWMVFEYAVEE